jgi:lysophospholipase L1-like esterase
MDGNEAIIDLAKKHNAGYWDLFNLMGGFKSIAQWHKEGFAAKDKVHFSVGGYHILGNMMFEAFERSYNYNSVLKKK